MITVDFFTPPPDTDGTGDAMHAYARVWPHVRVAVELCARELTKDRDEREDLMQEAQVALWHIDASRCDIRSMDDLRSLRRMLMNHMRKEAARRRRVSGVRQDGVPLDVVKKLS